MSTEISDRGYWDEVHGLHKVDIAASLRGYWMRKLSRFLASFLAPDETKRFVELGGAPGLYPILFHQVFGYQPYVIDYSEPGIQETWRNFELLGLPSSNAVMLDFLQEGALRSYENYFDVVASIGLLEHFAEPSHVLDLHISILKGGGDLIIQIPVFNSVFRLQPFFKRGVCKQHNLSLMNLDAFSHIVTSANDIEVRYLGYFGGINFGVPRSDSYMLGTIMGQMQKFTEAIQLESILPLNKYTSPYLMCVAKKSS